MSSRIFSIPIMLIMTAASIAQPNYRGLSYVPRFPNDLATPSAERSVINMSRLGTSTVALNVFWFQDNLEANRIAPNFNVAGGNHLSPTIESVRHAIDGIHAAGMDVLLKPVVDPLTDDPRATIERSEPDVWFASYRNFIETFADIADEKNVAAFSVGTELSNMERHDQHWRDLIASVRSRYDGELTYAACWNATPDKAGVPRGGYNNINWWNDLDFIGIDAYFPIATTNASLSEMKAGWSDIAGNLETFSQGLSKKIVFTEVGYPSSDGAARTPWADGTGLPVDLDEQAMAYTAMLETLWEKEWWDGAFFWSWETNQNLGGVNDGGLTPQHKSAEEVMARWYGGESNFLVHPQLLTSWEGNSEGWQAFDSLIDLDTRYATEGSQSLRVSGQPATDPWQVAADVYWSIWNGTDEYTTFRNAMENPEAFELVLDVATEAELLPDQFTYFEVFAAVISEDEKWIQQHEGRFGVYGGPADKQGTIRIPLEQFDSLDFQYNWFKFHLAHIHDGDRQQPVTYFVDNLRLVSEIPGDVNNDGQLSSTDIDALSAAIRFGDTDRQMDVNEDGHVDAADRIAWIKDVVKTWPGDSNLDGEFNASDLTLVFQAGEYDDDLPNNSTWAEGDWSGDREFDSRDLIIAFRAGAYEKGPRSSTVPEPGAPWLLLATAVLVFGNRANSVQ